MTYAANVLTGYVLAAVGVAAYASWVVRRGRTLGRELGIGAGGPGPDVGDESRPHD
ncbi:hypothetical protein [Candidatus Poriferisodalis sp.]|uniref:hypothetical protein n=1 Tax=Candidatus Poriferisodalis sp. TaxID=3101277 RepID=UPI003B02AEFD